ncbi:ankyrin repeat-containing protein BDA1-like [Syzygium oleosum]|uniref:ankyrin repeat-containing protein BDA1-like n=1 Tax=Syzygium oleosum TaxID=219896 RepID=UPI0024BB515A|nr:ankyrin repeat-containing protein BDA1-like [Syzygium oleosum]
MSLQEAIAADNVNELYSSIERDENILDHGSEGPFPNTPLHDAADKGKTKVAMEIAILKPSFARKLNRGGHSPMHLALHKKHYHTAMALMTLDPKLIRVRGRGGITPLHFVAGEKGENEQEDVELLELLTEFLSTCKSSIEDLTGQCETAVHVALKNHNLEAFKVLFGWLKRVRLTKILDWKDQDGNTVLHIAASGEQLEIINMLMWYTKVNAKNVQKRTALDIFQENPHFNEDVAKSLHLRSTPALPLSQFFSKELTAFEEYSKSQGIEDEATRNIILVVATLVATATYQAVLTPPGGYWPDSSSNPLANSSVVTSNSSAIIAIEKPHQAGNIILSGAYLYMFVYLNSAAFFVSVGSIMVAAVSLWPHTLIVYYALTCLSVAYCVSLVIEFPASDGAIGSLLFQFLLFFLLITFMLPWHFWRKHIRVVSEVDATRRRQLSNIPGLKE